MNKDAILASIIGFGIGLLITGGIILGPRVLSQIKRPGTGDVASATSQKDADITPTPDMSKSDQPLTIDSPSKETIVHDASITISGKAPKQTVLIIGTTEDEKMVETKETTTYQTEVGLKEGKNDISVVSVVNGKSTIERITVFYTPNK